MLVVVALVGIVATLALPSYRWATQRAREAVLRGNPWTMRNVIDVRSASTRRGLDGSRHEDW